MRTAFASCLLAAAASACGGGSAIESAGPRAADAAPGLFTEVTSELGLPGPAAWPDGVYFLPEIMQGGVGLLDYDGDGDLDLLHALIPPPGDREAAAPNRLYRQEDDGTFTEVAGQAGIADPGFGQGLAVGDVDNDGDDDVYVTNYGADALYVNNGDGTFTDATVAAGFSGERWSVSAAFCDYDADGWLDLFVAHYVKYDDDAYCQDETGRQEYCGPQMFHGEPDRLFRNDGDGTFTDVTELAGLALPEGSRRARGLGTICADMTGDGRVDLYVANDAESNQLWVNNGDGTFAEQGIARGVAVNRHGSPEASMGVAIGDVQGDGRPELFLTHLVQEHNTLYSAGPGAIYFDRTLESGLAEHDTELTGFGTAFLDYDHDGDVDLAVANGRVRRGPVFEGAEVPAFWRDYAEPNLLFENDGAGRFTNVSAAAGRFSAPAKVARGLAVGDLDRDGDLDLVLTYVDNALRVFRNDAPPPASHWIQVRGHENGRDALGAQVSLTAGGRTQHRALLQGYSYAGSSEPVAHFGLGSADSVDALELLWSDGTRERFEVAGVDRVVTVRRGEGGPP